MTLDQRSTITSVYRSKALPQDPSSSTGVGINGPPVRRNDAPGGRMLSANAGNGFEVTVETGAWSHL